MKKTKMLLVASLLCGFTAAHAQDNVVTATYGNATGNTQRTMTVALNHEKDYVAFHLVMDIPAGITVKDVTAKSPLKNGGTVDLSTKGGTANESTDFKVPFYQNGTTCNIVGYNYGNAVIEGTTGDVLLIMTLETASGVAYDEKIVKTSCTFVDADAKEVNLGTPETDPRLWGDVNVDESVSSVDVNQASNVYLKKSDKSSLKDFFAGDIDGNEVMSSSDINKISNIYQKK